MNGQTLQHTVTITNPQGFHMRPMTTFVQTASRFASKVTVSKDGRISNGKSILELMALFAPAGTLLTVAVDGPDAPAALDALVAVLQAPAPEESVEQPRA